MPVIQTFTSNCETCRGEIKYRSDERLWTHDGATATEHDPVPEVRAAIDATCPGCDYPEIGFSFYRDEFVCSRCGHTQTTRPKD